MEKMVKPVILLSVVLCVVFAGVWVYADEIILKDGGTRKGTVLETKEGYIYYERDGKQYRIEEEKVEDIKMDMGDEFDTGEVSSPVQKLEKILKLSLDMNGRHTMLGNNDDVVESEERDVDTSLSVAGEAVYYLDQGLGLGGGVAYLLARGCDTDSELSDPQFSFVPLYGIVKYRFRIQNFPCFAEGQLGYNFLDGNGDYTGGGMLGQSGGLYYGLGGGIAVTKNVFFGLYYAAHNGALEYPGIEFMGMTIGGFDIEVKYTKISLTAGVSF